MNHMCRLMRSARREPDPASARASSDGDFMSHKRLTNPRISSLPKGMRVPSRDSTSLRMHGWAPLASGGDVAVVSFGERHASRWRSPPRRMKIYGWAGGIVRPGGTPPRGRQSEVPLTSHRRTSIVAENARSSSPWPHRFDPFRSDCLQDLSGCMLLDEISSQTLYHPTNINLSFLRRLTCSYHDNHGSSSSSLGQRSEPRWEGGRVLLNCLY
ncbi:hypothetical protein BJ875DRAFT_67459 [Amylocarpus encephaloides]|uniref:Uncharacterized protein n=1 Tax=Amylocarpus encephaloides TaxID=45428 RepID=A0A9P7YGY5_9HELO|nr:hypothetical protein BJ875DRAFT_67459 [Amylocarpus encephaloides]